MGKHAKQRAFATLTMIFCLSYSNVRAQDLHSGFDVGDQQFRPMGVRHVIRVENIQYVHRQLKTNFKAEP